MAQIPSTQGNAQGSEIAIQVALAFLGSLSREDLQTVLGLIEDDILRLYEDRNVLLTDGGTITFSTTTVSFTESLKLHINSKEAGGAPTIIDLGSTTRNISADGRMIYATVNRGAGTAVITDDAATLPAVDSSNKEIFLIAKRVDSGTLGPRLYFRNGTALNSGDEVQLGSSGGGAAGYSRIFINT